ncbi:subtilisin-like protein [Neocallimastix sp. 'constans']
MKSIKRTINLILLLYIISSINAYRINREVGNNSTNRYYIIAIKDSSQYSFDIQPTKQDDNAEKLKKKDLNEVPKFNPINFNEIEEIISSDNCYSKINDKNLNDTTFCEMSTDTLKDNGKINIDKLEEELKPKKQFVSKQLETLAEIIIDNIYTYKNDAVTNELQNEIMKRSSSSLKELLDNKIFSRILKKTFNVLDVTLINAYLSKEIYEIVKDLPDVVECIEDFKIENQVIPESLVHITKSDKTYKIDKRDKVNKENPYYNITDIKVDTKWSGVTVEANAGHHLSLISQSKYDSKLIGKYDTNYYYPSTAGAGVDIYIVDGGINVNHADFNTTDRTVTCDAYTTEDGYQKIKKGSEESKNCFIEKETQQHGVYVASAAAGTLYGVAKKANIHVVAIEPYISNYISALKFIEENAVNPHKTVINFSSGSYEYSNTLDKLFNIIIRKGFMVVAASGNEANDACITESRNIFYGKVNEKNYPSAYIDVISVGSVNNSFEDEEIPDDSDVYNSAAFSNYGSCVDIFAPGYAYLASFPKDAMKDKIYTTTNLAYGTSFSSPMVAGVAALLISEHPEITFDQNILKKWLIDLSIKDILGDLERLHTPNRFLNIGKTVVYSANNEYNGCGILSGKKSCSGDACCSVSGYCGKKDNFCKVDCQSEFGKCSSSNRPSSKKDTEEPEYKNSWVYNYWMDLCLKFAPGNIMEKNIILTICDDKDPDYLWYISNKGDSKFIQNTYDDVCMSFDKNGIAYAKSCKYGTVIKDINTVYNKDAIQSDKFPNLCLKPILSDYNPYGITIFSDSTGLRVKMDKCNYNDEYQHWRLRDIPEIIYSKFEGEGEEDNFVSDDDNKIIITYNLNEDDNIDDFEKQEQANSHKKVWIYSTEKKLCLTSTSVYKQKIILEKCDQKNEKQQWLVPDNDYGYYVNVDKDACIIYNTIEKKLIINSCIETIPLEKLYVKSHASIIEYEKDTFKIYDELHDEYVCLNIKEENKKNKEILLDMVPCNKSHSKFILTTEFPKN